MIREKLLETLRQNELIIDENKESYKEGAFLFISFDLVNSTSYKSIDPGQWPMVFHRFYELVESYVKKRFTNSKVWRYAGDEILFYKQIKTYSELYDTPKVALEIIRLVTSALNNNYAKTKNVLFLKSTLWISGATYVRPQELENTDQNVNNLIITFDIDDKKNTDFLGADIDLGFRISKFAEREKVVLSAELAYLLYRARGNIEHEHNYDVADQIRIVSYEKLKGIWGERHYPIIWYHDNWQDPDKMFFYDDHFSSKIVQSLVAGDFTNNMKIKRLKKIFNEVDNNKVEGLISLFKEIPELTISESVSQYNLVEVHCVAVCFNNKGEILLGKRNEHKRRFPSIWEFGCGQLKKSQTFEECLKESYKEDFFAELNFSSSLIPVNTFVFEDKQEGRKIPGIIFVASVTNPEEIEKNFLKENHSEITWFDPKTVDTILEEDYVEDFKETVKRATAVWQEKKEA